MSYVIEELRQQLDGLQTRIHRMEFLRERTQDTTKIDLEILKDERQARAIADAIDKASKGQ